MRTSIRSSTWTHTSGLLIFLPGRRTRKKGCTRKRSRSSERPAPSRQKCWRPAGTSKLSRKMAAAREILAELTRRRRQAYVPPSHLAKIHAALGENDQAFAWLNKAYDEHDVWLIWLASEPMWDFLRSDPRFGNLLRRLDIPSTAPHLM